jgi:ribonuclease D
MGAQAAVALLFGQRFAKPRRLTTTNWANLELSERQLLYAANDAYAAIRVFEALGSPTADEVDLDLARHAASRPPAPPAARRPRRRRRRAPSGSACPS